MRITLNLQLGKKMDGNNISGVISRKEKESHHTIHNNVTSFSIALPPRSSHYLDLLTLVLDVSYKLNYPIDTASIPAHLHFLLPLYIFHSTNTSEAIGLIFSAGAICKALRLLLVSGAARSSTRSSLGLLSRGPSSSSQKTAG